MARLNYNSPSRTTSKQTISTTTTAATTTISRTRTDAAATTSSTASRSYRTLNFDTTEEPNPFQEPQSLSTASAAPIPSDTIASSSSSISRTAVSATSSRTKQHPTATTSNTNNKPMPSTTPVTVTNTNITTTSRAMAPGGQNNRSKLRDDDDDDQEYKDIPEDGSHVDDNSDGEFEEQEENLLIHLTPSQRDAAIENLEIETMDRIQKLRASIGVLTNSLKFRAEAEMNRLPAAIRAMTVEEFWFTYNGSAKEYLEQQAKTKAVANTAFLHALGKVDQKRKRETPGPADDLWQQKKRNRDEQRQKQPQASGYSGGSSSVSSNTSQHRPSHQSARHNPYPDQQQRRHQSPFVGPRSTRDR